MSTQATASNCFEIAGVLCKPPRISRSPAGIAHFHGVIEHQSEQLEAGLKRRSYVRIQVVYSADDVSQLSAQLTMGCQVLAKGFLHRHEDSNGLSRLVLHAQYLTKI
ncbi:primosomal replication protein N [Idiomarina xiamenensis]|uniref:Primosomal replication protein N n=1 Tax=Idiomarina xiamenensis 10-D-4 TaxID=740709 RepID=K2L1K9_9GAMM|nr:primosomal replication protein N [Idiomarina xiamenensis]EKE83660.1 primosomal replication protein N [Idiomarina xiamenensis 10-D-4]